MTDWEHELPDFLRFNKYGGVISKCDRAEVAKSRGVCWTCGRVTHKVTAFRSVPLDDELVSKGVCLRCHPDHKRVSFVEHCPAVSGGKAAKLLGVQENGTQDVGRTRRRERVARKIRGKAKDLRHSDKQKDGEVDEQKANVNKSFRDPPQAPLGRPESGIDMCAVASTKIFLSKWMNYDSVGSRAPVAAESDAHPTDHDASAPDASPLRPVSHKASKLLGIPKTPSDIGDHPVAPRGKAAKILGMYETSTDAGKAGRRKEMHHSELRSLRMEMLRAQSMPPAKKPLIPQSRRSEDPFGLHSSTPGDWRTHITSDQNNSKATSLVEMEYDNNSVPDQFLETSSSRDQLDDAWDTVKEMRAHPDDAEFLTNKCDELRDRGINQEGALHEIIDIMRRFPNERSLLRASIGALWSLESENGDGSKSEILEAGGAGMIIESLEKFPDDVAMLCWGFGALSTVGERIGGQAYLEKEGIVDLIQNQLKRFYRANDGVEVFYWTLRCISTLIYKCNSQSIDGLEGDFDISERIRATIITDTGIIRLTLQAVNSVSMDGITLELALKVFSHFDIESYVSDDRVMLMKVCEMAIQTRPRSSFPTLHHLACAMLCLTMKMDSSPDHEAFISPSIFANNALASLTSQIQQRRSSSSSGSSSLSSMTFSPPRPHSLEVMLSMISHLLCFGDTILSTAEGENMLKICCSIFEDDGISPLLRCSCCWVIWSIFRYGHAPIEDTRLALKATEAIQAAIPNMEHSPTQLTAGFAALSEVVGVTNPQGDHMVQMTVRLATKYFNVEMLHTEACKLLFNLCKAQEMAWCIAAAGGIDTAKKALQDPSRQNIQSALHLVIKLSVLASDLFSIEDFDAMIDASVRLKNVSPLAAKSWLGFLTGSITPSRGDFAQRSPIAISSIKNIMESYPKDESVQRYTCTAFRNMTSSIQQAKLHIDTSECVPLVIAAWKEHGTSVLEECCDALWGLMSLKCQLESTLMREVAYFVIEVLENHVFSSGHAGTSGEGTNMVLACMAIFADMFSDPVSATLLLGERVVYDVVQVINSTMYSLFNRQQQFPLVFEYAFCALHYLCSHDLCRRIIVNFGGVNAVVDGMSENLENASIQEKGCNILRHLAGNDLGMKMEIFESDGVIAIMDVIISHGDNEHVLSEAFQVLSCLSLDKSSRYFIAQQGGIMLMANFMSALCDSVAVHEAGLASLCSLASDAEVGILKAANVFSVVNDSLSRHSKDASIQVKGLALFLNLSMRSKHIKNQLLLGGCLKSITNAVVNFTSNPMLVSTALRTLFNLSDNDEVAQLLCEKRTLNLIIHAMMLNIRDLKNAMVGCKILSFVSDKPNDINIGVDGAESVVIAMMFHHCSDYVQSVGCGILSCYCSHAVHSDAKFADLSCKILVVILSAMSGFPKSLRVQQNAILLLRNMTKQEENNEILKIGQARIEEELNLTMSRFPKLKRTGQEVLKALAD